MGERIPAAVMHEYGKPPQFDSFDAPPAPAEGQLLVEVELGGLNPVDIAFSEQRYVVPSPPLPYVAGIEAVGRVSASATPEIAPGARVYVDVPVVPHGTFAAATLAYAATAIPIPEEVDAGLACAVGIAGVAAFVSLEHRARLNPGEKVVVLGATGVVGSIALQAARLLGASAIVAVGRDRGRLRAARELGATASAEIGEGDLTEAIREASGGPADVVIDTLCGAPAEAALEALAIGGRLVQLGRSAAETMQLRSATVRGRALSIIGHTNGLTPPDVRRRAYEWLLARASTGELRVEVERVPLSGVAEAWVRQKASPGHKLVLVP
ncbi:MAG TPA: zinc-binding alcohol dehydrogenase family protein [Solirubrobacteraceae bacterium]|nr:zinc-binding alcohol dehydrogenase family protein [Solirubrobacteraceae bacterium]